MHLFRSSGLATVAVALGLLAGAAPIAIISSTPVAAATGQPQSMTFDQLGTTLHFTVPADVTTVHLRVIGGSGGKGTDACTAGGSVCRSGGAGGAGGSVDMDASVTPGDDLQMVIGAAGTTTSPGSGGAAGGHAGKDGFAFLLAPGEGNGGGATYVVRGGDGSMLAVGAGGGGGGGASSALEVPDGAGGDGGAGVDGRGYAGHGSYSGVGGTGSSGSNTGGPGQDIVSDSSGGGGGGGGGGYQPNGTGGGAGGSSGNQVLVGGAGGGGAGGHSFSAASDAVLAPAASTGNGKVVITWTAPATDRRNVSSGQITSSANPSYLGEPVTFTLDLSSLYGMYLAGTVTIGTYDPTTGVELPQATWFLDQIGPFERRFNWTTVLPTGSTQVWASYSGDTLNTPWKSPYFTQLVGNARPRAVLALPSSSVDFGAQAVGTTSTKTVTIENISAAPWKIAGASATEPAFGWTGGTCLSATTTPLAIGARCTIDLAFTPTVVAPVGGTLTLLDEVGTPTVLTMSGSGITVPSSGPPPAPGVATITSISPASGSRRGGTLVTITGTNLVNVRSIVFGRRSGSQVACSSSTTCRVRSPRGSGSVDVRVVTGAGTSALTAADRFQYTR